MMSNEINDSTVLPAGLDLARTTDLFDNDTVPRGLLKAHRVAGDVWGRLIVYTGTVGFVFEDDPGQSIEANPSRPVVIPPGRPHHLELDQPATFAVEFHRARNESGPREGHESTGLDSSTISGGMVMSARVGADHGAADAADGGTNSSAG